MNRNPRPVWVVCALVVILWIAQTIIAYRYSGTGSLDYAVWPAQSGEALAERLVAAILVMAAGLIMFRRLARRDAVLRQLDAKQSLWEACLSLDRELGQDNAKSERESLQDIAAKASLLMAATPGTGRVCVALWVDACLVAFAESSEANGVVLRYPESNDIWSIDDPEVSQLLESSGVQELGSSFPVTWDTATHEHQGVIHGVRLLGIPGMKGILVIESGLAKQNPMLSRERTVEFGRILAHHLADSLNKRQLESSREALQRQSDWMSSHLRVIDCLSRVSQISATSSDEFLRQAVHLIPMAFDCKQQVAVEIVYGDTVFSHESGDAQDDRLQEPLTVDGNIVGFVDVWLGNGGLSIGSLEDGLYAARFVRQVVRQIELMLHHHSVQQRMLEVGDLQDAILNSTTSALAVVDPEGRVKVWNRAAEHLTGLTAREVLGTRQCWRRLFDARVLRSVLERSGPVMAAQRAVKSIPATITRENGQLCHLSADITPLGLAGRLTSGFVIAARDTTEEKRHRDALMAERNRMESVINALPEMVYLKDLSQRYTAVNQATCRFFGVDEPSALIGHRFSERFPGSQAQKCEAIELKIMSEGTPRFDRHIDCIDASGQERSFLVSDIPIRNTAGTVTGLIGVCHDVTEYRELQEQLLEARKMEAVGQLAGGAAHDFNNLLTVISLQGELLLAMAGDNDMTVMCVEEIMDATERASRLTQQLLAFGRRQIMDIGPIDVNECVTRIQDLYRSVVAENILLDLDLDTGIQPAMADETQIDQILTNLVLNASEAMPKGGVLTITTRVVDFSCPRDTATEPLPAGRYVKLSVADTGSGMTEETQRHLFEPFYTTKEVGEGSGMGLATAYGIVTQLDGGLDYVTTLGEGSEFSVFLPVPEEPEARESAAPVRTGLPKGDETLLLVEDERHLRDLTAQILERLGYDVVQAENGLEGIDAYDSMSSKPAMILSDVVMPELGGPQMMEQLAGMGAVVPVVFMTGYSDELIDRRTGLGANDMLIKKPFKMNELATAVRNAIDTPRATNENGE